MKENRMLPIGTETFRIFVDEAEDGVIRGRVSGGTFPEETLFRSLSRLILLLEEQLDTGGAPKASPIQNISDLLMFVVPQGKFAVFSIAYNIPGNLSNV